MPVILLYTKKRLSQKLEFFTQRTQRIQSAQRKNLSINLCFFVFVVSVA
jgi:hypothetical protein